MISKIKDFLIKNAGYSVSVARIGLAFVFLWFGLSQIFDAESFYGYVPEWAVNNPLLAASTLLFINGIFDSSIGFLLLIGFFTRIVALIAALHLLFIAFTLGYNDVAIRDVGLAAMAASLILSGAGKFSWDNKNNKIK